MTQEFILQLIQENRLKIKEIGETVKKDPKFFTKKDLELINMKYTSEINLMMRILTGPKNSEELKEWNEANRLKRK